MLSEKKPEQVKAAGEAEVGGPRRVLKNPVLTGWSATLWLSFTALGIIYGDIGTSPLYVFNAVFPASGPVPSEEDIIGALSAILWSISIVPLIKYALIALEFGTGAGEGGPFALYTALFPPPEETDDNRVMTTYTTASIPRPGKTVGDRFFQRHWVKSALFTWTLFGTTLTISDGLLTPAVSVVSAVQGIAIASPAVINSVVPISIAILVILFLLQALGTRRVGTTFAPIISIWLAIIAVSGAINLAQHPGVFRAFDPSRAVMLFVRTRNFDLLSGVLLSITGVEAMFANLGQFSKTSIRIGFAGFVYPCIVLAYLGQGARLIVDGPNVISNVFFNSIPGAQNGPFFWITFVFAILAAIIASQAMISATFSLVQQLTRLHAMPPIKIIHTADDVEGQVFVPVVNILIMIGTIGLTAGFGTGAGLTNAYGFAVSGVMIVTTSLLAISIVRLKHLPVAVAVVYFILSGFIDGLFWGSSLKKVPLGAWFPLGLAVIMCTFLQFWSWAKGLENDFDATHRHRLHDVICQPSRPDEDKSAARGEGEDEDDGEDTDIETEVEAIQPQSSLSVLRRRRKSVQVMAPHYNDALQLVEGGTPLVRLPVFALFHNSSANTLNGAPHSFSTFLKSYPALPQVVVFFNVRVVGVPHTTDEERFVVSRVRSFDGIYIATLRLGYRDPIDLANVAAPIRDRIVALEARGGDSEAEIKDRIALIDNAMKVAVTHILPHFHVFAEPTKGNRVVRYARTFLIESIYQRLKVNFNEYDLFKFGTDQDVLRMGIAAGL